MKTPRTDRRCGALTVSRRSAASGLPFPLLRTADPGEADEAADLKLLPAVQHREFHLVDLAALGVEDVAAAPGVAVLVHAPHDVHAFDRLVLALAVAFPAQRHLAVAGDVFRAAVEQLYDGGLELAVLV